MNTVEVLTEAAGIIAAPGTLTERAEELLALLQRVVPFDAGWIGLLPEGQAAHLPVARLGYDRRIRGLLDSPTVLGDVELVGLGRSRRPWRVRDSPIPPSEIPSWAENLEPAGFRDGVAAGLFTPDGRYLGVVSVHAQGADQLSEAARDLMGCLAAPIAAGVDPLRSLATIAGMVQRATAGVVLAPAGTVLPLPGRPDHRLLAAGSGVLAAARAQLAGDGPSASFLAPLPAAEGGETHVRITVLAAPADLRPFAAAVVLLAPPPDLYGLTRRELEVLGLLITGASNERIAAALVISARTVEAHVDHVRAKLAAPSRTAAAARALRLGLFVPPSLLTEAHGTGRG